MRSVLRELTICLLALMFIAYCTGEGWSEPLKVTTKLIPLPGNVVPVGMTQIEIEAQIDAIDLDNQTLTVLGNIVVQTNEQTEFRDDTEPEVEPFSLADLSPGDFLEVRALESVLENATVVATRVERNDFNGVVQLKGFVESVNRPGFVILGVVTETTPTTTFEDFDHTLISADEFFGQASGRLVESDGTWDGNVITATWVELEDRP